MERRTTRVPQSAPFRPNLAPTRQAKSCRQGRFVIHNAPFGAAACAFGNEKNWQLAPPCRNVARIARRRCARRSCSAHFPNKLPSSYPDAFPTYPDLRSVQVKLRPQDRPARCVASRPEHSPRPRHVVLHQRPQPNARNRYHDSTVFARCRYRENFTSNGSSEVMQIKPAELNHAKNSVGDSRSLRTPRKICFPRNGEKGLRHPSVGSRLRTSKPAPRQ